MKKIKEQFTKCGFNYKQIKREGDLAIFEQSKSYRSYARYEVVRLGRHDGYERQGSYIEPAETYPGSSLWGIRGWTYHTLDKALEKFTEIKHRSVRKKKTSSGCVNKKVVALQW